MFELFIVIDRLCCFNFFSGEGWGLGYLTLNHMCFREIMLIIIIRGYNFYSIIIIIIIEPLLMKEHRACMASNYPL